MNDLELTRLKREWQAEALEDAAQMERGADRFGVSSVPAQWLRERAEELRSDTLTSDEPYKMVVTVRMMKGRSRTFLVNRGKSVDRMWKALSKVFPEVEALDE